MVRSVSRLPAARLETPPQGWMMQKPDILTRRRMNRRKADFKFVYKYLEDEL